MLNSLRIGTIFFLGFTGLAGADEHYATQYTVTDIGDLGGSVATGTYATGINNLGQITGRSAANGANSHAFIYSNGQMTDLGTIGGAGSEGLAIDNDGVVVGDATPFNTPTTEAIIVAGGYMSSLGFFGGNGSSAHSINGAGTVAGFFLTSTGSQGFIREKNGATGVVPLLGTGTQAYIYGIDAEEYVVGTSYTSGNTHFHATISGAGITADLTPNLNDDSAAYALNSINSSNQRIVGSTGHAGTMEQPAIFPPGSDPVSMGNLGVGTGGRAEAVNNAGTIVGFSSVNNPHGFVYYSQDAAAFMVDLNSSVNTSSTIAITEATGINEAGQICANGFDQTDAHHYPRAYLLTPIVPPTPTPAPVAAPMVIVGKKSVATAKSSFVVKGATTGSVTSVTFQIGKKTGTASGAGSWSFKVRLKPGKNTIMVVAHGPGGTSAPVKVKITRSA